MPETLTWEEAKPQTLSWEDAKTIRQITPEDTAKLSAVDKAQSVGRAADADNTGLTTAIARDIPKIPSQALILATTAGQKIADTVNVPKLAQEAFSPGLDTKKPLLTWDVKPGPEYRSKHPIASGIIDWAQQASSAMSMPEVSAQLAAAAIPGLGPVITAKFLAQMAVEAPEEAAQFGTKLGQGDIPGAIVHLGNFAAGVAGPAFLAKGEIAKAADKASAVQSAAKILPAAAAETVKTVTEKGKDNATIPERSSEVLPLGKRTEDSQKMGTGAPEPKSPAEAQASGAQPAPQSQAEVSLTPTKEHDAEEYKKVQAEMAALTKAPVIEMMKPEFGDKMIAVGKRMEEIKNRNKGYAPGTEPKESTPVEPKPSEPTPASPQVKPGETPISMGGLNPKDPGEISPSNLALLGSSLKTLAESNPKLAVSKAFHIGESLAPIKDGVQNTLQGLKAVGSYLKTKLEGFPTFDNFMGLKGDRHLALSDSALNTRRFVKDSMKAIPDSLTREAISNWVDTGGDEARLKEGLAATKDRYKPGYERALKLTPEEITIAKNIQNYFEARLKDAQDAGILEDGIENYIHRYFEKETPWKQAILNELRSGIFTGQPALAKERIFQYDHEAEAAGYKPQKDFVKRVAAYDLALNKTIADRQLVKSMMNLKIASGEPWISVGGVANKVGGVGTDSALLIKPTVKPKNVGQYVAFDHPALRKWKWVAETEEGKPVIVQGSVLIHPDALKDVKSLFESSRIRAHAIGRAMLNVGSTVKQTMLDMSGFHQVQIGIHAAEHQRGQSFAPLKEIDLTQPDQRGLVRGGMVIGDTTGRQHFDEGLSGTSLSKNIPFGIGDRIQQYKEYLFSDYIPRIKIKTGLLALERNKELFPKLSQDELYHLTANQMNAAFGELNYAMIGRSATMQDALRLTMLSPDFTEARGRFAGQALTKYGGRPHIEDGKLKIGEQGKALLFGAAALYLTARILNKQINGSYHMEPENAFNIIHNGKAYSLRTVQGDILHAATDPQSFVRNRLNPVYGRTAMELASGRDTFGRKRSATQQAEDAAKTAIPISVRGLFSGREQSLAESLMNSMGITEHRESSTQRISQLAEKWKEKNKIYGEPGEFIYDPDKDKFRNITLAARYSDKPAVRSEILKAEQAGIPKSAIIKHYNLSAKHLFTGSTKANEEKFKASLTADQRKQYQDAIRERNDIADKVRQSQP